MTFGKLFNTFNQFYAAFSAGSIGFAMGMAFGWTNSPVKYTRFDGEGNFVVVKDGNVRISDRIWSVNTGLHLTQMEYTIVVSSLNLGALLASMPSGFFIDAVGRKTSLVLVCGPYILGWLFILAASDSVLLILGRSILGVAAAASTVVGPVYLFEISRAKSRGVISGLFKLQITMGVFFDYVMGTLLTTLSLNLLIILMHFIILVPLIWIPETPLFLLWSKQRERAENSLRWLHGHYFEIDEEIQDIENNLNKMRAFDLKPAGFFKSLKRIGALKVLYIVLGIATTIQMSAVNVVVMCSTAVFGYSSYGFDPRFSTMLLGAQYMLATLVSLFIVDKFGRRLLLLFSTAAIILCYSLLGAYFYCESKNMIVQKFLTWAPILLLSITVIVFALGLGTIPWIMINECFPPNLSGSATAIATTVFWFAGCVMNVITLSVRRYFGVSYTFWLFAIFQLLGFLFIFFVVPETRGKNSFEILEMIKKGRRY